MRDWLRNFLTWDGLLPLAVAAVPAVMIALFPRNDVAEMLAVVLIPMAAALVRSVMGARQIRRLCHGELPIGRQFAIAAAIVFLLLFEGAVTIFVFADDEPASAWLYPAALYAAYLASAAMAFIPKRADEMASGEWEGEST
jgi:hypothetical protein